MCESAARETKLKRAASAPTSSTTSRSVMIVAAALRELDDLRPALQRHELVDDDRQPLRVDAERLDRRLHARHVALVVGAPDVDRPGRSRARRTCRSGTRCPRRSRSARRSSGRARCPSPRRAPMTRTRPRPRARAMQSRSRSSAIAFSYVPSLYSERSENQLSYFTPMASRSRLIDSTIAWTPRSCTSGGYGSPSGRRSESPCASLSCCASSTMYSPG